MESVGYAKNQLVGLRVVRGPNWEWDTQDGGEGFVGTVTAAVGNIQNSRRVKVRWDSGQQFIYRIGDEDAYDLRVLDKSIVGVRHPGVECQGCGQKDIAGLRWQCFDCPTPSDLCTFCFVNGTHDQRHVNFRRYHHPSSDSIVVRLNSDQPRIPLKGIFSGALVVKRGADWKYGGEDGWKDLANPPIGKVVLTPTGREMTSGKVWVQWPCELDKSYSYRVGLNGKMDLRIAKAGIGGHYQPDTLPVLKISKSRAEEKPNDVVVDPPFVPGDRVKFAVGLKQLREMWIRTELDSIDWNNGEMEKLVDEIWKIETCFGLNQDKTVYVVSSKWKKNGIWLPVKALRRSTPWLPVGAVVKVINKSHSDGMDMAHDGMAGDFGRVEQVHFDGETVCMEFFTSDGKDTRTVPVSKLQDKFVDVSVIEKVDAVRKDLAKLLVSEVEKGSILSVQFLLKTYPDVIDCQIPYNGRNSTALSVACQKGNVEMVKLLLKHKASVNITDREDKKDKKEAWYNEFSLEEDFNPKSEELNQPVHHAALGNHPEVLRLLLGNGASPTNAKWNNMTPLHLAAMKGHIECVRVLLEDERCDLDVKAFDKDTAFRLAVKSSVQSVELFKLFLATGKMNIQKSLFEKNLLLLATKYNNFGAAKCLLSFPEGMKLAKEFEEHGSQTPLNEACSYGHNQIAKLMVSYLDKIVDGKLPWGIDTPNHQGETPLMIVLKLFNYELIELLIGSGANLQAIDKKGNTSFHYAARLYREKVTTFKGTKRGETNVIGWPNQEIAPSIFMIYNELKTKYPEENLPPIAAIIYYLVINGGIPHNLTLPEIKNLIDDDFLYDEITKNGPFPTAASQN